jgi:hypothetical protein
VGVQVPLSAPLKQSRLCEECNSGLLFANASLAFRKRMLDAVERGYASRRKGQREIMELVLSTGRRSYLR